jgi:hypothetical protein
VLGALASASASATLPEFKPQGTLANPVSFTITGGESNLWIGPTLFSCTKSVGTGTLTGAKSGTATLTFTGCGLGGTSCESSSGKVGEIVTEPLPFVLVYTAKEPTKQVAIDFNHNRAKKLGEKYKFVAYRCGSWKTVIYQAILAPATPLNTLTKQFTAKLEVAEGRQTPKENYTEELTGMEKSFPEESFNEGPLRETGIRGSLTLGGFKQSGGAIEERIEA